ncbi:putative ethanol metabolism and heat shock tolerance protein [Suhomyces tanzawaensis NRRL Y-17324]|uniref:Protein SYM1 n=1 Tax=Suhomyces tanzawaensis NRRL Y-17324 TaxID=984487 RepID=A0A1E4SMC0_9ASCO|nr:putative ethanol metabolism and heat shock tolerance protein [Suhomyces tanzawaensis NRRL Y-17324]ODV80676.1 putative ethanol metabolism and heat shock tolerance protein [Suhomyces tanzawaensis NRRL Y-17324]
MRIFRAYNDLLLRRPFITNMCSTGLFFGIGDLMAQHFFPVKTVDEDGVEEPLPFNLARTQRAVIYGFCVFGPVSVVMQRKILPRIFNPFLSKARRLAMEQAPKLKKRLLFYDVLFRVFIEQCAAGLLYIPMYNTVMTVLAGHENPLQLTAERLRQNWWTVYKASWLMWPGFQMFNLYFLPAHYRIVAVNVWSINWTGFLSFIHNTSGHGKGSGHRLEEILDIQDDDQELTMVYEA